MVQCALRPLHLYNWNSARKKGQNSYSLGQNTPFDETNKIPNRYVEILKTEGVVIFYEAQTAAKVQIR